MGNPTESISLEMHSEPPLPLDWLTMRSSLWRSLSYASQFIGKCVLDFVLAGLGVLLLAPLMLAIGLLIRLDSKGPVFYFQRRLGLGCRPFWMWKFRTMVVDAEERQQELEGLNESKGGVLFKLREDPRVTRVGRFLAPHQPR